MKILVTGATGFIGFPLLKGLVRNGEKVTILSRKAPPHLDFPCDNWIQADLASPETYREKIRDCNPEVIIHLAWQGIPDYSFEVSKINLMQSLNFLSFLTEIESCRKILVAGSCWETKRTNKCLENENGIPTDDFSWSKHALRSWMEMKCSSKDICLKWMRIFYAYGPRQRSESLVPSIIQSLRKNQMPLLRTPLNANDFIYIDDIADAFVRAVSTRSTKSGVFHLGTGASTPVLEVCRIAEHILNDSNKITQQIENESSDSLRTSNFWADFTQSKNSFGWTPRTSLRDGIEKTCRWMERN